MIYVVRSNTGQFYRRGKLVQSRAAATCGHSPSSVKPILARARATFPELQWEAVPLREAAAMKPATPDHVARSDCWCQPEANYADPDTGATVYVHKEKQ